MIYKKVFAFLTSYGKKIEKTERDKKGKIGIPQLAIKCVSWSFFVP